MFNNRFRKEKPIQGMMGMGGGATGFLFGGAGGGFERTGGIIVDDGGFHMMYLLQVHKLHHADATIG